MKLRTSAILLTVIGATLLIGGTGCKQGDYYIGYVVENKAKTDDGTNRLEYFKDEKFDANRIVDDIWEAKVIPAILKQATDLTTVAEAVAQDPDAAGKSYGHREEGGNYPWNFIVKGAGRIVAVNTKTRKGTLTVDLPPYDGQPNATIWIGPIVTSYSIRDALDFISFTTGVEGASGTVYKFDTQVQFAEVSNALNARGNKAILLNLEPQICLKLTDASFESFKENQVPAQVSDQLRSLKDQACLPKAALEDTIKKQTGSAGEPYRDVILKAADASDTGKGQIAHFYGAFTHQKSGEIIITPVQLEIIAEEGQS